MKELIKFIVVLLLFYIILNLLCGHSSYLLGRSIDNQIDYIDAQLSQGADRAMQNRYPEGALFSNSIFALSLIELSELDLSTDPKRAVIVDRCINMILSDYVSDNFNEDLPLKNGAFYTGWTNLTLRRYIESDLFEHSTYKENFTQQHLALNKRIVDFQSDTLSLAETYSHGIWPADNLVCISSLPNEYVSLKDKWLNIIRDQSTNNLGLINHDGYDTSVARGSSQALILYFLSELDQERSIQDNIIYKSNYVDSFLDVQLVREYFGNGEFDVDSGPIVFGYGSVATIVNVKTQSRFDDKEKMTWSVLNLLGMPINIFGRKYYLFEQELMFDIFMLWSSVSLKKMR